MVAICSEERCEDEPVRTKVTFSVLHFVQEEIRAKLSGFGDLEEVFLHDVRNERRRMRQQTVVGEVEEEDSFVRETAFGQFVHFLAEIECLAAPAHSRDDVH